MLNKKSIAITAVIRQPPGHPVPATTPPLRGTPPEEGNLEAALRAEGAAQLRPYTRGRFAQPPEAGHLHGPQAFAGDGNSLGFNKIVGANNYSPPSA